MLKAIIILSIVGVLISTSILSQALDTVVESTEVSKEMKDTRKCEQLLDGVYTYDDARRMPFCRTSNGYVPL